MIKDLNDMQNFMATNASQYIKINNRYDLEIYCNPYQCNIRDIKKSIPILATRFTAENKVELYILDKNGYMPVPRVPHKIYELNDDINIFGELVSRDVPAKIRKFK